MKKIVALLLLLTLLCSVALAEPEFEGVQLGETKTIKVTSWNEGQGGTVTIPQKVQASKSY